MGVEQGFLKLLIPRDVEEEEYSGENKTFNINLHNSWDVPTSVFCHSNSAIYWVECQHF